MSLPKIVQGTEVIVRDLDEKDNPAAHAGQRGHIDAPVCGTFVWVQLHDGGERVLYHVSALDYPVPFRCRTHPQTCHGDF